MQHHIRIGKVPVKKEHVVKFGLIIGAGMMCFDAAVSLAGVHAVEQVAHHFGLTGAASSSVAAALDALVKSPKL